MSKLHHQQQQETLILPPPQSSLATNNASVFNSPFSSNASLHTYHYKKSYIFRSLFLIASLTVIVLIINYYLISHCPKDNDIDAPLLRQQQAAAVENSVVVGGGGGIKKVRVGVYYEVLCPDSKHFIVNQLVPAWSLYGRYLDLHLVPFGKGRVDKDGDSDYKFSCQHGPEECHGNLLQSCIIQQFKSNQTLQLQIIKCSMERFRLWGFSKEQITDVVNDCRNKYHDGGEGGDVPLLECSNGKELLAGHGYETLGLKPRVSFIPTVSVDGSLSNQRQILRDFKTVICEILSKQGATIKANC